MNHGIEKSSGEVIAFTDDDAIVDKNWLRLIVETFNNFNVDCVGGRVLPIWLGKRPKWLTQKLMNVLAILDLGEKIFQFKKENNKYMLYGVNYAFKKTFFEKHGNFNTKLCARGSGNEDQEIFERLISVGGKAIYNPNIIVRHKIFPERLKKQYFRKWHYLAGKDKAEIIQDSNKKIFGIEGFMAFNCLKNLLKLILGQFYF